MSESVIQSFIQNYGYWAIFIGTFIEGETISLLGGFAAHRGYLELPWVIVIAFFGSFMADQLYFYLGRRHGTRMLSKHRGWVTRVERVQRLIERYHTPLIIGIRFMIGLRTVGPFVMGMSDLPARRFFILNAIGAALWAIVTSSAGYIIGETLTAMLGTIKHIELEILGVITLTGFIVWLAIFYRRKRHRGAAVK
jgi:membrane protein DedA with SNARE-associated domain